MAVYQGRQRRRPLIGQLLLLAGTLELLSAEMVEVCISEEYRLTCTVNEVILVTSAEYGRMEVGRCIKKHNEFLGCANDVLHIVDRWCSGRQECNVMVTNDDDLEAANVNCLESLKKYLKLLYSCLPVESKCSSNQLNTVSAPTGYLSSVILDKKGCGSARSPWIISASPGQTIHIDIIDFAVNQQDYNLISCRSVYGFILERSLGINHTICGRHSRERALYTSKTNSVEIQILQKERRQEATFLLSYSVTGCSEIVRLKNAWYKREGREAVIGCENNDKEWRLTCIDNKWVGEAGNCSEYDYVPKKEVDNTKYFNISSVVVISGIAGVAVVLSVIAVVCGVVYINKYRMKQEVKRANLYKTYSTIGSNVEAYYRPVTVDQSENNAACWDMSLVSQPLAPQQNQMTLLSEKCTCPTLQMRNQGDGDKTERDRSLERQSLYSSIRSS